jgi:hypothetical protein
MLSLRSESTERPFWGWAFLLLGLALTNEEESMSPDEQLQCAVKSFNVDNDEAKGTEIREATLDISRIKC